MKHQKKIIVLNFYLVNLEILQQTWLGKKKVVLKKGGGKEEKLLEF